MGEGARRAIVIAEAKVHAVVRISERHEGAGGAVPTKALSRDQGT